MHASQVLGKERDTFPPGNAVYQLALQYCFNLSKAAEITVWSPLLCPYLYEHSVESQLLMVFDCNKQHLLSNDYGDVKNDTYIKLEKGECDVILAFL